MGSAECTGPLPKSFVFSSGHMPVTGEYLQLFVGMRFLCDIISVFALK